MDKLQEAAEKHSFQVPYDGSNKFYNETKYDSFIKGAEYSKEAIQELVSALEYASKYMSGLDPRKKEFDSLIQKHKQ